MINKESLYEKTSATENDWRYSDERMELRAECFRALKFYLMIIAGMSMSFVICG